jgi:hypothetical protein
MNLRKKVQDVDRGSTRAYCLEDSLCNRLWPCSKTDYMVVLLLLLLLLLIMMIKGRN